MLRTSECLLLVLLSVTVRTVQREFAFVRPGLDSTSRMTGGTGKPSSLVRALFLALLAVCQLGLGRACTPAVIWCPFEYDAAYRTAPSSPLQKLTSEEFERSLSQFNVTEPAVVAEELCVEDLRNSKVSPSPPLAYLSASTKGMLIRDSRKEHGKG